MKTHIFSLHKFILKFSFISNRTIFFVLRITLNAYQFGLKNASMLSKL